MVDAQVDCEGYDNATDPYILRGSCGAGYRLEIAGKEGLEEGYVPWWMLCIMMVVLGIILLLVLLGLMVWCLEEAIPWWEGTRRGYRRI